MLTADEAYDKHIKMWKAMQKELGDNPSYNKRVMFKALWCAEHGEDVECSCYLCQYDKEQYGRDCPGSCGDRCLVDWGTICDGEYRGAVCGFGKTNYRNSPISEILALPRRKVEGKKD